MALAIFFGQVFIAQTSVISDNIGLVYVQRFHFVKSRNQVLLMKIVFSPHQNKLSDVNKTYIIINIGQKFKVIKIIRT